MPENAQQKTIQSPKSAEPINGSFVFIPILLVKFCFLLYLESLQMCFN